MASERVREDARRRMAADLNRSGPVRRQPEQQHQVGSEGLLGERVGVVFYQKVQGRVDSPDTQVVLTQQLDTAEPSEAELDPLTPIVVKDQLAFKRRNGIVDSISQPWLVTQPVAYGHVDTSKDVWAANSKEPQTKVDWLAFEERQRQRNSWNP